MSVRITDLGMMESRMAWMRQGQSRVAAAEQEIASGRRINKPSDNPSESARLMRHDLRLQRVSQFARNNDNAKLWVGTADQALQTGATYLERARTLAVQAGNDTTLGAQEGRAIAADVRSIAQGMMAMANTKISGRAIFAGTADSDGAYDATTLAYVGDAGQVTRALDTDETVVVGYHGPDIFGDANPGDPMNGNVFEMLGALADAIENGNNTQIRAGIEAVDTAMARIGVVQGRVGAASQQLDAAETRQNAEKLNTEEHISKIRDVDIADAVIRLRSAEVSYEATMSATSRALSRSLLDFIR
ncbi:MAG: flagellar hook-associated protein FlgL [Acidimicrobiia bacterium]|nr:flagellar hook-associated protein FlgL [Acidimicrobiia bacterium]